MNIQQKILKNWKPVLLWAALLFFLMVTHPAELPVYILLVPFVLLALALYSTFMVLMSYFLPKKRTHNKVVSLLLSLFLVICLGLQSVGQLTFRDFMIVLFLSLLGYFYVYRNIIGIKG